MDSQKSMCFLRCLMFIFLSFHCNAMTSHERQAVTLTCRLFVEQLVFMLTTNKSFKLHIAGHLWGDSHQPVSIEYPEKANNMERLRM